MQYNHNGTDTEKNHTAIHNDPLVEEVVSLTHAEIDDYVKTLNNAKKMQPMMAFLIKAVKDLQGF